MSSSEKSKSVKSLPCSLTPKEFVERAKALAEIAGDIEAETDRAESSRQQFKATLAELEAKRSRLSSIVARGEEFRDVEVETTRDYEKGRTTTVRLDTGAVIFERAMSEDERQRSMELKP